MFFEIEGIKGVHSGCGFEKYVTALAAISTVWAPFGDVFLPPKTHAAIAAIPGPDGNQGFINKLHKIAVRFYYDARLRRTQKRDLPYIDLRIRLCEYRTSGWYWINADPFSGSSHTFKGDDSIGFGKECVILPHTYIFARVYLRSKLSHQYIAC
jgi:hypothetical protein